MKTVALIGAGQRGTIYANYVAENKDTTLCALVEPDAQRRATAQALYHLDDTKVFACVEDFFACGKIANAVIIASMDTDHYTQCIAALKLGYDVLLEKPVSPNPKETIEIEMLARKLNRKVVVCHVLRYTPFFGAIKNILNNGKLGRIVTIQHNENIGNFHMAHSFVRGNWRSSTESSPIIMQKSCHDMDILYWLVDSECEKISSFGALTYFTEKNAPQGSTAYCCNCTVRDTCRFDAEKMYLPVAGGWPASVVSHEQSEQSIKTALQTSPFGRCVYRCDNDVCDHQTSIIEFKNGVTATFNLSGFTNKMCRTLKIMCENGELRCDDGRNKIEITYFSSSPLDQNISEIVTPEITNGAHGGGDFGLMKEFLQQLTQDNGQESVRSSITHSVESHIMAYCAEQSRLENTVIYVEKFRQEISK